MSFEGVIKESRHGAERNAHVGVAFVKCNLVGIVVAISRRKATDGAFPLPPPVSAPGTDRKLINRDASQLRRRNECFQKPGRDLIGDAKG